MLDLASDTNYITHKAAERLRLRSEDVTLIVHGVAGMTIKVKTKRYLLRVRVKADEDKERAHELLCYGLDEIAKVHKVIKPKQLQKFFPEVKLEELVRPKEIELLISHREGRLAPQRVKVVEDLVLWDSPLGKIVGGAHPDLFEEINVAAYESKTHFARSMRTAAVKYEETVGEPGIQVMSKSVQLPQETRAETNIAAASNREFLEWWKWDSIGAACEPMCGACRCGNCQPGGKEMTLAKERELEIIKKCLTYVEADVHSKSPHWHSKYPWTEDPASLPNNDQEELDKITESVEEILRAGGFFLKHWVRSNQKWKPTDGESVNSATEDRVLKLPNQPRHKDNKAIGLGYLAEEDRLYIMTSINCSKRKKKMRVGQNLLKEEVRAKTHNPLTRRELLSQVAGLYDPIGLVTPVKQKGAILV